MSNNQKQANPNHRYIARTKEQTGQYGKFYTVLVDNPSPLNNDGTVNPYHKGMLLWIDAATGKKYVVKAMSVKGVSEKSKEKGMINSLMINLADAYQVVEIG